MDVNSVLNGIKQGLGNEIGSFVGELSPEMDPQELLNKGKATLFKIATEQGITEAAMNNAAKYGDVGMITLSTLGVVDLVYAQTQGSGDTLPENLRLPFLADEQLEAASKVDEKGQFVTHQQEREGRAAVLYTVSSVLASEGEESALARKGKALMGEEWKAKLVEPEDPADAVILMTTMFEKFKSEQENADAEKREKVEGLKDRVVKIMEAQSKEGGKVSISAEDVLLGLGVFSGVGAVANVSKAVAAYRLVQKMRNPNQNS